MAGRNICRNVELILYTFKLSNDSTCGRQSMHSDLTSQQSTEQLTKGASVFMLGIGIRQTDRHLYLIIKLRVVPSGAKSTLLSKGALSTKYTNCNADIL